MKRILVVDDSLTIRQLLVFALRRMKDVEIIEAQDGMDGLTKVTNYPFDLALIDINMPVMDGLRLISFIRGEPNLASLPICMITTESDPDVRERAFSIGADEYLTKPVLESMVISTARKLLDVE
jgi:two-component system, chemotaxis family, chemotaxis protein CheY